MTVKDLVRQGLKSYRQFGLWTKSCGRSTVDRRISQPRSFDLRYELGDALHLLETSPPTVFNRVDDPRIVVPPDLTSAPIQETGTTRKTHDYSIYTKVTLKRTCRNK
jgi:hypothetical protein